MAQNTLGSLLTLTTFGESHGPAIGGILDGLPAGIALDLEPVRSQLRRRASGQGNFDSPRREADEPEILSGIFEGKTTGAPLAFIIRNLDARTSDYDALRDLYRPSHADLSYQQKYHIRDYRGGGRSSARETATWVTAGAIVSQWLESEGIHFHAFVSSIAGIRLAEEPIAPSPELILSSPLACPDPEATALMLEALELACQSGDTAGGVITGQITGLPAGLGEPVFAKFHAMLGHAMLGINAVKGFEVGEGFRAADMTGSRHNDEITGLRPDGGIITSTNHDGGIMGGISNGNPVIFRVAFKPVASISRPQHTVDKNGKPTMIEVHGRHDVCVVPRAVPVVQSLAALVTADLLMQQRSRHPWTQQNTASNA